MKITAEVWTIEELYKAKNIIDPKPQYQRTAVWQPPKRKLLIDSILRGYDIPKFYLRETPPESMYKYEVTDGQQRIRAIWDFIDNVYHLDEATIGALNTKGLSYGNLIAYEETFNNYQINIALIEEASQEEIRTLFARLQMGERLNPVELRHALSSNIGNVIFSLSESHSFFNEDCKIPYARYKHQDYLDNAITLCYYDANRSIKANDMRHLYNELSNTLLNDMQPLIMKITTVLQMLHEINSHKKGMFKNKWAFVDIFYLLFKNLEHIKNVKSKVFADNFWKFELERRNNQRNPETLIDDKTNLSYDKDLYDYIIAFKTSGADKNNCKIRYRVLYNKLFNKTNIELI